MDRWLPTGFHIADHRLGAVHAGNEKYQLYSSADRVFKLLVVGQITAERWTESGLLASNTLHSFQFGTKVYACLAAGSEQLICETTKPPSAYTDDDIAGFAHSLARTRRALADQDLGDALYIERYSVLLPLSVLSEPVRDAELLGFWVSGGVRVSIHSAMSALIRGTIQVIVYAIEMRHGRTEVQRLAGRSAGADGGPETATRSSA